MTDPPLHIRPAQPGDRDQVWPLARDLATSYVPERPAFDRSFGLLLADPAALILVAEAPGPGLTGYLLAISHPAFHANGEVAWVEELMVAAPARGSGVGRALMASAETWARQRGAAYLALATRRAAPFYKPSPTPSPPPTSRNPSAEGPRRRGHPRGPTCAMVPLRT